MTAYTFSPVPTNLISPMLSHTGTKQKSRAFNVLVVNGPKNCKMTSKYATLDVIVKNRTSAIASVIVKMRFLMRFLMEKSF